MYNISIQESLNPSLNQCMEKDTFLQSNRCVEVVVCPEQRAPEERFVLGFQVNNRYVYLDVFWIITSDHRTFALTLGSLCLDSGQRSWNNGA